ncbi:MAG: protein kinase [Planctomycetota bacterium]
MPDAQCPTDEQLHLFNQGLLDYTAIDEVVAHLEHCAICVERLENLSPGSIQKGFQLAGQTLDDDVVSHLSNDQSIANISALLDDEVSKELDAEKPGIDAFVLGASLGSDGFFAIHQAVWEKSRRAVLVKIPLEGLLTSYQHQCCFIADATAAYQLAHENILPVVMAGSWDKDTVFVAYEQVEGMTLQRLIEKELALSTVSLLTLCGQITSALSCAHSREVLHRNLNPGKIMIGREKKNALVFDFGFVYDGRYQCELIQPKPEPGPYDSPEAVRNDPNLVDQRTDIYSFGAIFEQLILLTSDLETEARNELFLIAKKCQLQSRSSRFQSIDELQNAIAAAVARETSG